jgi:hypothetical protein
VSIDEIMKKFVVRYSEKRADWAAFEDAQDRRLQARRSTASSERAAPASTTIRP